MTAATAFAQFFGGRDDGATRELTKADFRRGYVDSIDTFGQSIRYTIVALDEPHQVDDLVVTHRLQPAEGLL